MGMFDYVRTSMPIFSEEEDKELQTKDLENVMAHYWISPAGQLFEVDHRDAFDLKFTPPDECERPWGCFEHVPTGKHSRLRAISHWGQVRVYPSRHGGPWEEWPEALLYFRDGRIELMDVTSRRGRYTKGSR